MHYAKLRSRSLRHSRANMIITAVLLTLPTLYIINGVIFGCWTAIHDDHKFSVLFTKTGKNYRMIYRPEIYLKDQQAHLFKLEKENIEIQKRGEKPSVTSPIVLWH